MSPWARLMIRITPNISERPQAKQRVEAAEQHALDDRVGPDHQALSRAGCARSPK